MSTWMTKQIDLQTLNDYWKSHKKDLSIRYPNKWLVIGLVQNVPTIFSTGSNKRESLMMIDEIFLDPDINPDMGISKDVLCVKTD